MAAGDSVDTSHMDAMSRAVDPDQGRAGPFASNMQQGNGPDAVPIPITF